MAGKIPGARKGVWLVYHAPGRANQAANHVKNKGDTDVEPALIQAASPESPSPTPYTVERLIKHVTVDESLPVRTKARIALYWKERGVPVLIESLP